MDDIIINGCTGRLKSPLPPPLPPSSPGSIQPITLGEALTALKNQSNTPPHQGFLPMNLSKAKPTGPSVAVSQQTPTVECERLLHDNVVSMTLRGLREIMVTGCLTDSSMMDLQLAENLYGHTGLTTSIQQTLTSWQTRNTSDLATKASALVNRLETLNDSRTASGYIVDSLWLWGPEVRNCALSLALTLRGLGGANAAQTTALADFQRGLELEPNNSLALTMIGCSHYASAHFVEVINCLQRSLELNPPVSVLNTGILRRLVLSNLHLGQASEAVGWLVHSTEAMRKGTSKFFICAALSYFCAGDNSGLEQLIHDADYDTANQVDLDCAGLLCQLLKGEDICAETLPPCTNSDGSQTSPLERAARVALATINGNAQLRYSLIREWSRYLPDESWIPHLVVTRAQQVPGSKIVSFINGLSNDLMEED